MRKMMLLLPGLALFMAACTETTNELPAETQGYVPVYTSAANAKTISSGPARPTVNGGKMYTTGSLLFQVETDSGIHVINYANPASPQKIGFIRSLLCREVTVKNNYIYTNNLADLVVIDISNINAVHEVSRVQDAFPDLALQYPEKPNAGTIYFECPDPSKGFITRWELKTIKNPKCWR